MKDVSIVLPSIRPENLEKFYSSAESACKKNSFEIIIASPYLIPESLLKKHNVKYLHTYTNPTIAFQMSARLCDAKFIYNTTDDGLIQEDAIDLALELSKNINIEKDMINMIYDEGVLDIKTLELLNPNHAHFPESYWSPWTHGDLRLPGINKNWKLCMHFFISSDYFIKLGGFDCNYEYSNHALHDLAFRVQENGGKIYNLPKTAFFCSHGHDDHKPVEDAQLGPDIIRFNNIYKNINCVSGRIYLNYDDWKGRSSIWERRFDKNNLKISKQ